MKTKNRDGRFSVLFSLLAALGLVTSRVEVAWPQIVPDNTLGAERSVVNPDASVRGLPAELVVGGASRSANLFHSFDDFNVKALQRVYFANPAGIENILTRVTGSSRSDILGTLGVDGGANLFLLNPHGILFGPNARLDVAGSFVASTANSFVFPDSSKFSATNPQAPPLLTVNLTPGVQYGAISPRSTIASAGNLAAGKDLTLVADHLDLQGQIYAGGNATLRAMDSLSIRDSAAVPFVVAAQGNLLVQGDRSVEIAAFHHADSGFFARENLVLRSASPIQGDARYSAGGDFHIQRLNGEAGDLNSPHDPIILAAGNVVLGDYTGASLHILAGGSVTVGDITIIAPDSLANTINPGNTTLFNGVDTIGSLASFALSDGTPIAVNGSSQTTVDIRAGVDWTTFAGGAPTAGPVLGIVVPPPTFPGTVTAADISVGSIQGGIFSPSLNAVLLTNQYRPNPALSGDIMLDANASGSSIRANSRGFSVGSQGTSAMIDSQGSITLDGKVDGSSQFSNGGNVTLLAGGDITLNPDSANESVLSQAFRGLGGTIVLKSQGTIAINGGKISNSSILAPSGTAGGITLDAQSVQLRAGAELMTTIGTLPGNEANAGAILVTARERVALATGSQILSNTSSGAGNGGDISIVSPIISLIRASSLNSSSSGEGNAGKILLLAHSQLRFDEGSGVFSSTTADGQGGNIRIVAGSLSMTNGSKLESTTGGRGNAGNIFIDVAGEVAVESASDIFIGVRGGAEGNGGNIDIQAGSFSLARDAQLNADTMGRGQAGNIFVRADKLLLLDDRASITASTSGQSDAGEVTLQAGELISILNDSQILTMVEAGAAGNAQQIRFQAPNLVLDNQALISAATFGTGDAGRITVQDAEVVSLANNSTISTAIAASAIASQPSNIEVQTRNLFLSDGSAIAASTSGQGNSGNIFVRNAEIVSLFNSNILTAVESGAVGQGGIVDIQTRRLSVADRSQIRADTSGQGNAGNIFLHAANFDLRSDSTISTAVNAKAVGQGGTIDLNADFLALDNARILSNTLGQGDAGKIVLQAVRADLRAGSAISSAVNAGALGQGGTVDLTADFLNLNQARILSSTEGQGDAGRINLGAAQSIVLANDSTIASTAGTGISGNGGSIALQAPVLLLLDGSQISVSTEGLSDSNAGQISLQGDRVALQDGSQLAATTAGGISGGIGVNARILEIFSGGQIRTTTSGNSAAGDIVLQVLDSITLDGDDSGLFANTVSGSSGVGGSIFIDPRMMAIRNGAGIVVDSQGSGTGGNIQLQAGSLTLDDRARISAITASSQGGNIDLLIDGILLLRRNSSISATAGIAGAGGDGGNIDIRALFVVAPQTENSDIKANAFAGRGGNISFTTNGIFGLQFRQQLTPFSDITVSSQLGVDGTVVFNTPAVDPSRGLADFPNFVEPTPIIATGCSSGETGTGNFAIAGQGGVPQNSMDDVFINPSLPEGIWTSSSGEVDRHQETVSEPSTNRHPASNRRPAQGMVLDANGNLLLTAARRPYPGAFFNQLSCQNYQVARQP